MFLGFHIQRKARGDGRRVVLTIPAKQALASVMHKIKKLTGQGTCGCRKPHPYAVSCKLSHTAEDRRTGAPG